MSTLYKEIKRVSDLPLSKEVLANMLTILAYKNNNYSLSVEDILQNKIVNVNQAESKDSGKSVPISLFFRDGHTFRISLKNGSVGDVGDKGKTGKQGEKGANAEINKDRSENWLIIANDTLTNDSKKALSALQGVLMREQIDNLSETYLSEYQYDLLFNNHVFIDAIFETTEEEQEIQLISSDPDSHQRYVKYWTFEAEGEEEYFILNHYASKDGELSYDSYYCDLWNDIYLGGKEGYFKASTNQLSDGNPLFVFNSLTNEYDAIEQYDSSKAEEEGYDFEYGERRFKWYLSNAKAYIDVKYTISNGYDINLDANELKLNIYVFDGVIDGNMKYSPIDKSDVDVQGVTTYYTLNEDNEYVKIENIESFIEKKSNRYYVNDDGIWNEVDSINDIDLSNFEEYIHVEYDRYTNYSKFTHYETYVSNRGEISYKIYSQNVTPYSFTYYIYDDDRQYFTRRILTEEDEAGNITFKYEYTPIIIPFWIEAEFITSSEDMNIRLITNQIYNTDGDEEVVDPIFINEMYFEEDEVVIAKNLNKDIKFIINPSNANQTNMEIVYDESLIKFYEDGRIAAIDSDDISIDTSLRVRYLDNNEVSDALVKLLIRTPVSSIDFEEKNINIYPGTSKKLEWTIVPEQVSDNSIRFESSDNSLISISEDGTISPRTNTNGETLTGSCTVYAIANDGFGAKTELNVLVANPITSIEITSGRRAFVGRSFELETKIMPETATETTLEYESSNPDIISIDANGKCTPKSVGECILYAKSIDGSNLVAHKTFESIIGIDSIEFEGFDIDELQTGLSKTVRIKIMPENAYDKHLDNEHNLMFSDPSILEASPLTLIEGSENVYETTFTALNPGNTQIIVIANDGSGTILTKEINTTIPISGISLNYTNLVLYVGDSSTMLRTTFDGEQPSNTTINWHTSNERIATVDAQGRVMPVSQGNCIISAISDDGNGVIASCEITVKVKVESIELNNGIQETIKVVIGNYEFINAKVSPDAATDQILTWTSSDDSICTIEDNGVIFAKNIGEAIITAASFDGNASQTITVEVVEKID